MKSFANQVVIALKNAKMIGDLNNYFRNTLEILIQAMESHSIARKGYYVEVARYATQIGSKMGMTEKDFENLYYASLLHDIGKIKMNLDINSENNIHPIIGANTLKHVKLFEKIAPIVKHHHEHYDGTGFPSGLKGENIPIGSRIITVVEDYLKMIYNEKIESISKNKPNIEKLFFFAVKNYDPKVIYSLKEIIDR